MTSHDIIDQRIKKNFGITGSSITVLRAFNIGERVNLHQIKLPDTLKAVSSFPNGFRLHYQPLALTLGTATLPIAEGLSGMMKAHLWPFGSCVLQLECGLLITSLDELISLSSIIQNKQELLTLFFTSHMDNLILQIKQHVIGYKISDIIDDYTYFTIQGSSPDDMARLLESDDLACLVLGEVNFHPSRQTKSELQSGVFQYSTGDLTIINYHSAVIFDEKNQDSIMNLLTLGLGYAEEIRSYHGWMKQKIQEEWDRIHSKSRYVPLNNLLQAILVTTVEIAKLWGEVGNSLEIIDDNYLARILRHVLDHEFRVNEMIASIRTQQQSLNDYMDTISNHRHNQESSRLERIIIYLILAEIGISLSPMYKELGIDRFVQGMFHKPYIWSGFW